MARAIPSPAKPASISADAFYDITVNRVVDESNIRFHPMHDYNQVRGSIVTALGDAVETAIESPNVT